MDERTPDKATAVDAELRALESDLTLLRQHYEAYFLGIDRVAPTVEHTALRLRFDKARKTHVKNTVARHREEMLWQRFLAHERLWGRICREIEEGTYRRDLFKVKLRASESGVETKPTQPAGIDDAKVRGIFDAYVEAKKNLGEPLGDLTFEKLKSRLSAQLPELTKQHGTAIDFKVAVKNGKAVIRAVKAK